MVQMLKKLASQNIKTDAAVNIHPSHLPPHPQPLAHSALICISYPSVLHKDAEIYENISNKKL